jgi:ADP-heptose:LPS heptosyltransferase
LRESLPEEELIPQQEAKKEEIDYCKTILPFSNFIIFQYKGSSSIRTLPVHTTREAIKYLLNKGYNICIVDLPSNNVEINAMREYILRQCPEYKANLFNFSPYSFDLSKLIALISLSKGVVSCDSASIHLAASLNKPAVGIYGPFPGELRLGTYPNVDWIDCPSICAPCFINFKEGGCPNTSSMKYGYCFTKLSLPLLVKKVENLFGEEATTKTIL